MANYSNHLIIGSGKAGTAAAFSMRSAGFAGRIVLLDDEGVAPYDRPPLSKEILNAPDLVPPPLYRAEKYADAAIELMPGRAASEIDIEARRVVLSDGALLEFDRLLLATGGRSRRLDMPGNEHIHYLRSHADALMLRDKLYQARSVVCIGAGVIGLEIASAARTSGAETTVVERGGVVMGRCLAQSEVGFVENLHRNMGVDLRLNVHVTHIAPPDAAGRHLVSFSDGSEMIADCIAAGVGMTRNTELGERAGVTTDNGHLTDTSGRTSCDGIYAAGDVAAFIHPLYNRRLRLESWHHAQGHGAAVGRAMCDGVTEYNEVPRFWSDQFGTNIQVAGLPDDAVETVLRGDRQQGRYTAFHLSQDGRLVAATAVNAARDMRPSMMLIGASARPEPARLADPEEALMSLTKA